MKAEHWIILALVVVIVALLWNMLLNRRSKPNVVRVEGRRDGLVNRRWSRGGAYREMEDIDLKRMWDPLVPPIRRGPFTPSPGMMDPRLISIATRGPEGPFQQVGYLSLSDSSHPVRLPLYGRHIYGSHYQYYTTDRDNPTIKITLPIRGDTELYEDDSVHVDGYEAPFRVSMYDQDW